MSIDVLISTIDLLEGYLPYQWMLLKTYAGEIPDLAGKVVWRDPVYKTVKEAQRLLRTSDAIAENFEIRNVDVLGLSCYVWNSAEQYKIAEIAKQKNPDCLVVAGGPEVPHSDAKFFEKHPYIDIVVKRDGEIPFRKILLNLVNAKKTFTNIPGLIIKGTEGIIDTGASEVLPRFHLSPWLPNLDAIEKWIKKNREPANKVYVTYETNRGCPYSCSYCNWGSNTMSKIRPFEMENIQKEIMMFSKLNLGKVLITDANFGILPRDLEITEQLTLLAKMEQKPEIYFYPAKNNRESVTQVVISLHKAGLFSQFYLGLQSTDPATLKAIGRSNMGLEKQKSVSDTLRTHGIPVNGELILGCPGETVGSWRKTVTDTLEMGLNLLHVFRFQVLENTPASEPEYRKKWKIETIVRRGEDGISHNPFSSYRSEFVCQSLTFTKDEYIEMELYLHTSVEMLEVPEVKQAAERLREQGITYKEFFDGLYDNFFNSSKYTAANRELQILRSYIRSYVNTEGEDNFLPRIIISENGKKKIYQLTHFLPVRWKSKPKTFNSEFISYLKVAYPWDLESGVAKSGRKSVELEPRGGRPFGFNQNSSDSWNRRIPPNSKTSET